MAKKLTLKDFQPTRDWILLPYPEMDTKLHLDEATKNAMRTNVLEVLKVGPETKMINAGDTVMIDPNVSAMVINLDDSKFVLVAEYHVLGKCNG